MITLSINGKKIKTVADKTLLEAALQNDIYIPNLCYHPDIEPIASCRLCIVEIEGMKGFPTACTTVAKDGMAVRTDTVRLQQLRRSLIWLILSELPAELDELCQLKKVVEYVGVREMLAGYVSHPKNYPVISDEPLFIRDANRCILCGRCVRMCQEIRGVGVIGFVNRGINTTVGTSYDLPMKEAACKFCGACVEVCPSGALTDKEKFEEENRENILLPCKDACPAGIDVPRYVRLIAEGRFQDAVEVIREKTPFPYVLGCVCPHRCEEVCRRCEVNEPIAIRALKRFVAGRDSGRWRQKVALAPETGKKVAIVGSGPAGLTAAWFLRKSGHSVTVFEALSEPGGMMRIGIPKYRLPEDVLNQEIKDVENIGVEVKTNTKIESLNELFNQGFDAIFLALGAAETIKMAIPGEDDHRVLDGISLLKSINFGNKVDIAGEVAVVGGGDVAIDVARSALRTGAERVTILYRRTRKEMSAAPEEIKEALNEGVNINFLVAPQRVLAESAKLKVECIRMKLGEPDASGRRRPVPIDSSEFIIEVDRLIIAIGQKAVVPEEFNLRMNRRGYIYVDEETLTCSREGVFAGGDVVSGPASVIEAVQAGRKAAISIDKYLGGKGQIDQKFVPEQSEDPRLGRDEGFADGKRCEIPTIPVDKRLHDFLQIECGLDEKTGVEEAKRCLRCQLRLKIASAPLPPEKGKPQNKARRTATS